MRKILSAIVFIFIWLSTFSQSNFDISKYYGIWRHDDKTNIKNNDGQTVDRNDMIFNSMYLMTVTINEHGLYYDVASTKDDVSSITQYSCRDFQYKGEEIYEVKDTLYFKITKTDTAENKSIKTIYKEFIKDNFEPLMIKSDCVNADLKKMFLINSRQLLIKFQDNYYIFSLVKE